MAKLNQIEATHVPIVQRSYQIGIVEVGDCHNMVVDHSSDDVSSQVREAVADVFAVYDLTSGYRGGGGIRLRGRLLVEASEAYRRVAARFKELGHTPLFRRDGEADVIFAVPGILSNPSSTRLAWVPAALFLTTLASVLFVGATMMRLPPRELLTLPGLLKGWPFALSLLSILAAHELGHYFTARRFGTPVSLPHFIPMPLSPLGTMGAVINMKGPPRNRRQLLAIAAAGPLSGLVLAIPVLILGLSLSPVGPIPWGPVLLEGNSLLYILLKLLMFGRYLPSNGIDVDLHPVAFAGWAGLLVTALNLIPAGQLDGGHIVYALLGHRARWLNWVVIAGLVVLGLTLRAQGLQWDGWFLWAALLSFFSQRRTLLLDEITDLDTPRKVLALLAVVLLILTFVPIPMRYMRYGG